MYKDKVMYKKAPKKIYKASKDLPQMLKEKNEEVSSKQRGRKRARKRAGHIANPVTVFQVPVEGLPVRVEVKDDEMIRGNRISYKQGYVHIANPVTVFQVPVQGFPVSAEVKDNETSFKQKPKYNRGFKRLPVRSEVKDNDKQNLKELVGVKKEQDKIKKEEENRVKFENLVNFLKTVPKVEASEEEKKLMSIIDNDMEERLRIQEIIEKRRRLNV